MSNSFTIPDNRTGFSMKVNGVILNRPDLHEIAAELKIKTKDVLVENTILTIYNTSKESQEIIDANELISVIAMTLGIPVEDITELQAVKAVPKVIERDSFADEDEED